MTSWTDHMKIPLQGKENAAAEKLVEKPKKKPQRRAFR